MEYIAYNILYQSSKTDNEKNQVRVEEMYGNKPDLLLYQKKVSM